MHVDRLVEELAGRVDRDPVPGLADELRDRLPCQLPVQVPQRQLQAAQRLDGQPGVPDPPPCPHPELAGERVDGHELAPEDERCVHVVDERRVHLGERAAVAVADLTPADDPIGLHPHQAEVHRLAEDIGQRRRARPRWTRSSSSWTDARHVRSPPGDTWSVRYVVIGAGAIGGATGGRLHQHGHPVVLVARGPHFEALAHGGLRLRDPDRRWCSTSRPSAILPTSSGARTTSCCWPRSRIRPRRPSTGWRRWRRARYRSCACRTGWPTSAWRSGSSRTSTVSWCCSPPSTCDPGSVVVNSSGTTGILDVGRAPDGVDEVDARVAADLSSAIVLVAARAGRPRLEAGQAPQEPRERHRGRRAPTCAATPPVRWRRRPAPRARRASPPRAGAGPTTRSSKLAAGG